MQIPLTPLRFLQRAAAVHPDRTAIVDGTTVVHLRGDGRPGHPAGQGAEGQGSAAGRPGRLPRAELRRDADRRISPCRWPAVCWSRINTRLSAEEIAQIVEHSGAGFLLADAGAAGTGPREAGRRRHLAGDRHPARGDRSGRGAGLRHQLRRSAGRRAATSPIAYTVTDEDARDQPELHLGHHRQAEGRRLHPPRRLPELPRRGDPPGLARRLQLPVDAADVPLQRLVHHLGADRGGRHPRLPARGHAPTTSGG